MFCFCADHDYTDLNWTPGGSVLVAVHYYISGYIHRYDLELTNTGIRIKIDFNYGSRLLVRNHYFLPIQIIKKLKIVLILQKPS
jgi:hypothetical protein